MERKSELIITKDNYKGYSELYKKRVFSSHRNDKHTAKMLLLIIGVGLAFAYSMIIPALMKSVTLLLAIPCCYVVYGVCVLGYYIKGIKKENQELKEQYPYLDFNISTLELEESLEKAKVITKDGNYVELNVKQYEDYHLKAEQIKQDYFNETKYDRYVINPPIEEKELEKVKVKIKTLGTR